jgi:hypothetical protein
MRAWPSHPNGFLTQGSPSCRRWDRETSNRDISKKVCPWNGPKFVQITSEQAFLAARGGHGARLIELMGMDQAEFSRRILLFGPDATSSLRTKTELRARFLRREDTNPLIVREVATAYAPPIRSRSYARLCPSRRGAPATWVRRCFSLRGYAIGTHVARSARRFARRDPVIDRICLYSPAGGLRCRTKR